MLDNVAFEGLFCSALRHIVGHHQPVGADLFLERAYFRFVEIEGVQFYCRDFSISVCRCLSTECHVLHFGHKPVQCTLLFSHRKTNVYQKEKKPSRALGLIFQFSDYSFSP